MAAAAAPSPPPAPTVRIGRVTRIVLVVSLALNLLVLGLVAGAWFRHDRDMRQDSALQDIGFGPFIAALPAAERRALGKALVERAGAFRLNRDRVRAEFDALLAALRAEPFDIAAVQAAVDAQQSRLAERQEIGEVLLLDRIAAMSDGQRAAFADALQRGLKRGSRDRRPKKKD